MKSFSSRSVPVLRLLSLSAAVAFIPCPSFGQTWTRIRTETAHDLTAVHFADARHGYVTGAFGTLLRTSDGGETWTPVATPVSASFVSVAARSADEVLIGRTGLHRTGDGGSHWDSDVGGFEASSGSIFDILFVSPANGFLTKSGAIFATVNGGTLWQSVADTGLFLDDLHHAGGQTFFATGGITYSEIFGFVSRGDMARSRDGGVTWDVVPAQSPAINEIHAAVWENGQTGIVFTFTNKAHRTTDGGDTWQLLSDSMTDAPGLPLPAILMDAVIDSAGRIVAVDFSGNFLESADGLQWVITPGTGEPLTALTKLSDGSLVAVGNSGNLWKRTPPAPASLPLAIEAFRYDPDKHSVTLDATGTAGRDYVVEVSRDLAAWEEVQSFTAKAARFSIKAVAPAGAGTAYFRVAEAKKSAADTP
jgi:photosystem II stability/assembly factor-like uncharacterized protein